MIPQIELRAAIYVAVLLLGGWGGWSLASHHYEAKEAAEQVQRDKAIQAQQEKAIAQLQAQQAATQAAETQYAILKATADDTAARLARSVSEYSALRGSLVSATSTAAALADAASERARRNNELTELVRQATDAALSDAAKLTALQQWIRDVASAAPDTAR